MKKIAFCVLALLLPFTASAGILGPEKQNRDATYFVGKDEFASAIVVDVGSGMILYHYNDEKPWSGASLTKIMSSYTFIQNDPSWSKIVQIKSEDEVGGGRLRVDDGAQLSEEDLFFSSLTASANNAATAMPRVLGFGSDAFLVQMNATAKKFAMRQTSYVDMSGMDPSNITSARDIAKLAFRTFSNDWIRRAMTTAEYEFIIRNTGEVKRLKNTNYLLIDPAHSDVYVTGGKTGFLYESMYNFVTQIRPATDKDSTRTLIVVVLGSPNRDASFESTKALAKWTWENYTWD